ncbi:ribonuclease P protein component [Lusitaniella coriacea]|uniref:ribonuclease P protein component n=1 Tax=Lusitaniella coriacea TaxID=1983105 RepID=UPI003CEE9BA2
MGLPKANRLKHWRDFQLVFNRGIARRSRYLTLRGVRVTPKEKGSVREQPCATQVGISIGKKVSKKAVVRNRIKRQLRRAVRELMPSIIPGWKIVLVVKPGAVECEYEHFLRELKQVLTQAEVLNGH